MSRMLCCQQPTTEVRSVVLVESNNTKLGFRNLQQDTWSSPPRTIIVLSVGGGLGI